MTDREMLELAFLQLQVRGYVGGMVRSCCRTCASYRIERALKDAHRDPNRAKIAYVLVPTGGLNEPFMRGNKVVSWPVFVNWQGDAQVVCEAFREVGFDVTVPPDDSRCVEITGRSER